MGEELANLHKAKSQAEQARRDDLPKDDGLNPPQRRALRRLREEAAKLGSFLSSGGKGGLDPRMVRQVMQRDGYKCLACGQLGDEEKNGGIGVHHKGGIVASAWLSRQGHQTKASNLSTVCAKCHDKMHEEARKDGVDSSQVTPAGDIGTDRDRGLPRAKF